jgi:hypothetical protein
MVNASSIFVARSSAKVSVFRFLARMRFPAGVALLKNLIGPELLNSSRVGLGKSITLFSTLPFSQLSIRIP